VVKIRLKRLGAKKRPYYRLVVADSRSPRDGRFIEELGTYDPITKPATVRIDEAKVRAWMSRGAQPSDTARSLLEQQGILPRSVRAYRPRTQEEVATPAPPAAVELSTAAGEPVAAVVESAEATEAATAAGAVDAQTQPAADPVEDDAP
jgi:small subunit ribosomal protein S16